MREDSTLRVDRRVAPEPLIGGPSRGMQDVLVLAARVAAGDAKVLTRII